MSTQAGRRLWTRFHGTPEQKREAEREEQHAAEVAGQGETARQASAAPGWRVEPAEPVTDVTR